MSNDELLKALLRKGNIQKDGITDIVTINCYGGLQKTTTINGITIQSIHSSKYEMKIIGSQHFDDELYDLIISEKDN